MNNRPLLHVLIIEESLNDIEMYQTLITDLGYDIKLTRVEDKEDIEDAYEHAKQDILLYSYDFKHNTLKDICNCLAKLDKEIAVICLYDESIDDDITLEKIIDDGASALINKNDIVQFKYTIKQLFDFIILKNSYGNLNSRYIESEKRCQVLMSSSKDAISYIHEGMHVTANDPYIDLFGFKDFDAIEGLPIMDMVSNKQQEKFKKFLRSFNETELKVKEVSIALKNAKGNDFSAKMEFSPATIDGESCTQIVIRNTSDSKVLEKQLALLSKTDQLTGLFNRNYLIEILDKKIKLVKPQKNYFSFFFISIDNYQTLSENLGVLGSDQLISNISSILKKAIPEKQLLCRYTGCNYCLILDQNKAPVIEKVASHIIEEVQKAALNIHEHVINPTVSIGICQVDESLSSSSDALDRAERACNSASQTKPAQFLIYQPKKGELTQTQLDTKWQNYITLALKENKFTPMYTPIVNLSDEFTHRYQVKQCLIDENGKTVKLKEYQEAATRTGMAKFIDLWLISNTLKLIRERLSDLKYEYSYFIQLSTTTLEDPTLFRWLSDEIKKSEIPPKSLVFTVKVEDAQLRLKQTKALSNALKSLKCGFSLDNFGSGPNPFQISQHIPFDYVKIQPDFVKNLSTNKENQESIKEMFDKAKSMRKNIIIPGVNDPGSLTVLWGFGAELIQGDFVGAQSNEANYDFSSMVM